MGSQSPFASRKQRKQQASDIRAEKRGIRNDNDIAAVIILELHTCLVEGDPTHQTTSPRTTSSWALLASLLQASKQASEKIRRERSPMRRSAVGNDCNGKTGRSRVGAAFVGGVLLLLVVALTVAAADGFTLPQPLRRRFPFSPSSPPTPPGVAATTSSKPYYADFAPATISELNTIEGIGRGKTAVVAGATGYIGRAVARECVTRGYNTIALVRDVEKASLDDALDGTRLLQCDVTDAEEVLRLLSEVASGKHLARSYEKCGDSHDLPVDIVASCLAAESGTEKSVYEIDYQASVNLLEAGSDSSVNARHYLLLSAFCCRNPLLKLQQAKLKLEAKIAEQSVMTYSIVRPTAFFKSVSGQLESILEGNSYVLFGDGTVTHCNPIAEEDLATYMLDSAVNESMQGRILNVGGPDGPLSNKRLAEMMFESVNLPPKFVYISTSVFDFSISLIEWIARTFPSQKMEDVLETAKIGKYYAVEVGILRALSIFREMLSIQLHAFETGHVDNSRGREVRDDHDEESLRSPRERGPRPIHARSGHRTYIQSNGAETTHACVHSTRLWIYDETGAGFEYCQIELACACWAVRRFCARLS